MTAPARTRTRPETRPRSRPASFTEVEDQPATTTAPAPPKRTRERSTAAERAYARRAQRAEELRKAEAARAGDRRPKRLRLRLPRSRTSFVLVLMALLAVGVAATLWLSTQAIAGSYRLDQLQETNSRLVEQTEQLQRQVTTQESPSSLAERARTLGMVPGGNPARLVVEPDGSIRVVGEPEVASAPAPPPAEPAPEQEPDRQERPAGTESGGD